MLKNAVECCMMKHICGDIDNIIRIGEKMKLKKICSVVVAAALTFSLSVTPILADEVREGDTILIDVEGDKLTARVK